MSSRPLTRRPVTPLTREQRIKQQLAQQGNSLPVIDEMINGARTIPHNLQIRMADTDLRQRRSYSSRRGPVAEKPFTLAAQKAHDAATKKSTDSLQSANSETPQERRQGSD